MEFLCLVTLMAAAAGAPVAHACPDDATRLQNAQSPHISRPVGQLRQVPEDDQLCPQMLAEILELRRTLGAAIPMPSDEMRRGQPGRHEAEERAEIESMFAQALQSAAAGDGKAKGGAPHCICQSPAEAQVVQAASVDLEISFGSSFESAIPRSSAALAVATQLWDAAVALDRLAEMAERSQQFGVADSHRERAHAIRLMARDIYFQAQAR